MTLKLQGTILKEGDKVRITSSDITQSKFGLSDIMPTLVGFVGEVQEIATTLKRVVVKHPNSTLTWIWHLDDLELHKRKEE